MSDSLLGKVRQQGNPLIENETVVFVWEGQDPPQIGGDFTDWQDRMISLSEASPGCWTCEVTLPNDGYFEYSFFQGEKRLLDPFNRRKVSNGVGAFNNFFTMPAYRPNALAIRQKNVLHGQIIHTSVACDWMAVGKRRQVILYSPPVAEPTPLLVVYDGPDYYRRGKLVNLVDNLIAAKRMRPVAMAMVQNGRSARFLEYACSDSTVAFILDRIIPLAREQLNLVNSPGSFGVLGASMGGVMALYTALRVPQVFGFALSQSGAFTIDQHELVAWDLARYAPVRDVRIWLDAGRFEWLLEPNRAMAAELARRGYSVDYLEFNAGHNYSAWSDDVWRGLEKLFAPETPL